MELAVRIIDTKKKHKQTERDVTRKNAWLMVKKENDVLKKRTGKWRSH